MVKEIQLIRKEDLKYHQERLKEISMFFKITYLF